MAQFNVYYVIEEGRKIFERVEADTLDEVRRMIERKLDTDSRVITVPVMDAAGEDDIVGFRIVLKNNLLEVSITAQ